MSKIGEGKSKKITWSRTVRPATPAERASYEQALAEVEAEKDEILADARRRLRRDERLVTQHLAATGALDLSATVSALKASREAQGMTLADVSAASGMSVPALSSLETGRNDNPTLRTLQRYASAIGRRLVIGVIEESAPGADIPSKSRASAGPAS